MNRLILKYAYPITFAILAVLAWVVYRIFSTGGSGLITFVVAAVLVWGLGTCAFLYFWPLMTYSAYERAIVRHGLGGDPIPVNTLYAVPTLSSPAASNASLLATGTNDVLYVGGLLDLSKGPQVLHVPDMASRYYSVQFTDPSDGTNFAYVGKRTTGTEAGDYLISGPGWKGTVSQGMTQISSPNNSVLVVGRVFVESDRDLPTAYGLAQQIQLTPLSHC
ncbi:MAG TPA: DUF1254 domain-containing protein [Ktedonosporobacter sp.]|jgi:hypothetical protein|nr:DUF1254 domain-containing protein [Ktedonosporobacter sp.]